MKTPAELDQLLSLMASAREAMETGAKLVFAVRLPFAWEAGKCQKSIEAVLAKNTLLLLDAITTASSNDAKLLSSVDMQKAMAIGQELAREALDATDRSQ